MMTSNEQLIYESLKLEYPNAMQKITEISYNSSDKKYFIESDITGFNFDLVLNVHPDFEAKEKSPDALFYFNNTLYFVEFKEGKPKKDDIRLKIHEAIITLFRFCQKKISTITREDFFKLQIKYLVVCRCKHIPTSFEHALRAVQYQYNLVNLDGCTIQKSKVVSSPQHILEDLHKISNGDIKTIKFHDSNSIITSYSI